jgi:hypothetical protein
MRGKSRGILEEKNNYSDSYETLDEILDETLDESSKYSVRSDKSKN